MGPSRSILRARPPGAWLLAALVLASGCHFAPAKVWNLEQLHAPDGTARHRGRLRSDFAYLLSLGIESSNFGGPDFRAAESSEKTIDDPLGACLENVIALAGCPRDERVAALQAAAFAWLGVDCTYLLSRERCVSELGALAQALRLGDAPAPPEGEPATPEAVLAAFEELRNTMREVQAAPALAGDALRQVCARVQALPLERAGTLRLLRASNALLVDGESGAVFAPLRELRLDLARRATALALRAAFSDAHGRVRAAALEASMRAFPSERAQRLRWALSEPMADVVQAEEVSLRALELLARYGVPARADGAPEEDQRAWHDLLVRNLMLQIDGPHTLAACRALAKLTGEAETLRYEVWLARWRAHGAERAEPVPEAPGGGS